MIDVDIDTAPARPASRKIQLRPLKETDRSQVFLLNNDVFGDTFGQRFRKRFTWAFEDNLFPERTPKWVLIDGPKVVGFLATVPLPYRIDDRRIVAHTSCDFMVAPSHRFHGIKLMREFFRACPNSVSSDDVPATIKLTEWLGAKPVGDLVRHMKPLDARVLGQRGRWRGVPAPLWWPATQSSRAAASPRAQGSSSTCRCSPRPRRERRAPSSATPRAACAAAAPGEPATTSCSRPPPCRTRR